MQVCVFVVLSNHYHLLLRPRGAAQLAAFMSHFNGNLAKEAGRLHSWRQKFWGRRYRAIPVSFEPEAQIDPGPFNPPLLVRFPAHGIPPPFAPIFL